MYYFGLAPSRQCLRDNRDTIRRGVISGGSCFPPVSRLFWIDLRSFFNASPCEKTVLALSRIIEKLRRILLNSEFLMCSKENWPVIIAHRRYSLKSTFWVIERPGALCAKSSQPLDSGERPRHEHCFEFARTEALDARLQRMAPRSPIAARLQFPHEFDARCAELRQFCVVNKYTHGKYFDAIPKCIQRLDHGQSHLDISAMSRPVCQVAQKISEPSTPNFGRSSHKPVLSPWRILVTVVSSQDDVSPDLLNGTVSSPQPVSSRQKTGQSVCPCSAPTQINFG
jgi:hypothetical protein